MQPSALPPQSLALLKQGLGLLQQGKWEEAETAFRRVLAAHPDFAELQNDHGNLLLNLARPIEAETALQRAVALKPGYAPAWCNLGNALMALERRREAVAAYERALTLDATLEAARYNLGMAQAALGNFREGWANYESRWASEMQAQRRTLPGSVWRGERPAAGEGLVVYAEQGLGDTLQFCRFLRVASKRGFARVTCEVPAPLARLLKESFREVGDGECPIAIVARGEPLPPEAWHCAMLSLPLALGAGTDVPLCAGVPYLRPTQAAREKWAAKLAGERPRAGLVWSVNLRHKRGLVRIMGAAEMAKAIAPWTGEVFGLVKEVRAEDKVVAARWPNLGPEFEDFDDTASAIERLDLVVTVDTSVAHLAGALGKRTFLVLPFGGDWRWGEDAQSTAWYPTMTLFRQPRVGDWAAVAAAVAESLKK